MTLAATAAVAEGDYVVIDNRPAGEAAKPTALEVSRQKVRIRTYDQLRAKFAEARAKLRGDTRPADKVAAMTPSERVVYDDQIARDSRRLEEAKTRLAAHRATMTEDDFAKIKARDEAAAAAASRSRGARSGGAR